MNTTEKKKKGDLLTGSKEMENVAGVLEYELVMHFKCGLEFYTFFFSSSSELKNYLL